jgi:hypothetical protein
VACYLQLTTEEYLYICILDGVWGSKTNKLARWQPGDQLIVYVDRALAARFTILGESYYDTDPIWPGELYPYRIPIRLDKIIAPTLRPSMGTKALRSALVGQHSTAYGIVLVLGAQPVAGSACRALMDHLDDAPPWVGFNASQSLQTLMAQRMLEQAAAAEEVLQARPEPIQEEPSRHTQMQFYLAQLGYSLGFEIWIPKPDQGRDYHGTPLSEFSRTELPPMPFNEHALRIIRNIDVIWLADNSPAHLFEVEHTTAVYSGLLRMSDLIALIPALSIQMYICAGADRKEKVRAEVNRPTFTRRSVPLVDRCRFIPFEKLTDFMESQREYLGHFNVSILDELSESLVWRNESRD